MKEEWSQIFAGVRFVLVGLDPTEQPKVRSKLVNGGGVDLDEYGPRCTHLIVDRIVYDDSECTVARSHGKTVVRALWVDHCIDAGVLVDATSILYRPVKDLNGIPGAKSLSICLTGYQRQDRDDIMRMVGLMGAFFSKPLVANKVTHLICYKFEGEKYELAKKLKKIKLVNHRWLEDCLRAWEILHEYDYNKSGYELEIMEAEAKDSEEETEDDTSNQLLEENVPGSSLKLHSGSAARILKGSEVPRLMNPNDVGKSTLSGRTEDTGNENILVVTPRKDAGSDNISELGEVKRTGGELTGQVVTPYDTAHIDKESSVLLSDPILAKSISQFNAEKPHTLSYSRNIPWSSPGSEFSGMLSGHGHRSPLGVAEQYKVKDGFPSELNQSNINLDVGNNNDLELGLERGRSHKLSQKRKASLSNASSRSPRKVNANSKSCATRSPLASARTEGLLTGRLQMKSSPCHGNGDVCFEKNDVRSSAINQSVNPPKIKPVSIDNRLLNDGFMLSDGVEFTINSKMMEWSPKISGMELEKSILTSDVNNGDKELYTLTGFQIDKNPDPEKDHQNITVSCPKIENCEPDKRRSPVDLGMDNGSNNATLSGSFCKKTVAKKSLASKSKLSSGSNRQRGSLCLSKKNSLDDAIFSMGEGKEAEYGKALGTVGDMPGPAIQAEMVIEKKTVLHASSENKVEKAAAASEDDETEAPDEDIGANNDDAAREEMTEPMIPQSNLAIEKKLEAAQQMDNGIISSKNATMTLEVEQKVVEGDNCKSDEILTGANVKGKNKVFRRSKKTVVKRTEKSEIDNEVERKKIVDGEKMELKLTNKMQHLTSKLKSKPVSLDNTEKSMDAKKDDKPSKNDLLQGIIKGNKMQGDLKKSVSTGKDKKLELEKEADDELGLEKRKEVQHSASKSKNRTITAGQDKKVELEKGTDGEKKLEKAKEVHHSTSKSKSKTASATKAQNYMEEKENTPIETGHVGANSAKQKRETVATKCNRKPTQLSKTLCGTNDDGNQSGGGSNVKRSAPACFILSGHRLQRKEFQQIVKRLKGRVCRDSHNWSYQATHFIVPDPIRRTEKFFAAAATGRWILKTDYLCASNQAGRLLSEEPYEWFKNGLSDDGAINLEAPRKWRLLRERTGHGAFYGMRIVIYGECIAPSLDTLKRVVRGGDGVILATSPPYTRFLKTGVDFAVVSPGMPCVDLWVQEFVRHEIPCVLSDYLVEYICKPGSSLEKHVLFNTNALADKSYANLLSRLEEIIDDLTRMEDDGSVDISCQACGLRDRAEVMLICGDDTATLGCGVGTHIDCCDPPLEAVPEEDWFCPNCSQGRSSSRPTKKTKRGTS